MSITITCKICGDSLKTSAADSVERVVAFDREHTALHPASRQATPTPEREADGAAMSGGE